MDNGSLLNRMPHTIYDRLAYFILLFFLFTLIVLLKFHFYSYITIVISVIIGCLIFILLSLKINRAPSIEMSFDAKNFTSNIPILFSSTSFFFFFALSLLELSKGFYTKTVFYYIFISICAGLIFIEIFFIETKKGVVFNLTKSFLLVSNVVFSNQIIFPEGIGLPDITLHIPIVTYVVKYGYIPDSIYAGFPCHHILVASVALISNSNPKMTYLLLGAFVICLGLLFVFIIGNTFVNQTFGLLAALIYTCMDYLIMYGSHPVHQSYNYFYSILIFAIILYIYKNRTSGLVLIYITVIITMIFSHHLSAMITLILLFSIAIINIFHQIYSNKYGYKHLGLIQLFFMILFVQWIYCSKIFGNFVSIFDAYYQSFLQPVENLVSPSAYDQIPFLTVVLNSIGSSMLTLLSVIGFCSFSRKSSFFHRTILISSISVSMLLGIGIVFKQVGLLPDRLYPYIQLFGLVFLASGGIFYLLNDNLSPQKKMRLIPITVFIMLLSFFSCSSTIAGFETSPFVEDKLAYMKLYSTSQDELSEKWIMGHVPQPDKVYFSLPISYSGNFDLENIHENSFLVHDLFYYKTGFVKDIGNGRMGSHLFIKINEIEASKLIQFDKYYNNKMIEVYHKNNF